MQFSWEQKSRQLDSVPSESKACLQLTEEQGSMPRELKHAVECSCHHICIRILNIENEIGSYFYKSC